MEPIWTARISALAVTVAMMCGSFVRSSAAADWPQFGRDGTRNAVSLEKHPPTTWDIGKLDDSKPPQRIKSTQRNIKWSARLGTMTYGDPVVSNGLVWVGTNNGWEVPKQDASVLACFRESDGKLLYRYVSPRLPQGRVHDWPTASMACSPLIEDDRLWFVTNRAEVVCLDIAPLRRDESEPKLLWRVDMIGQFGVFPRGSMMALAHVCSVAGYKDYLYVITSNGVDENYGQVVKPEAPSLICFKKETGEAVWKDNSPGQNILYAQWSSPTIIEIQGRAQCVAPQGDGWVRSFDALTGKPIWQFDMNRKVSRWQLSTRRTRNSILASPVFADGRIYIASGQHPEFGEGQGRLVCLDPTKQGDISSELAVDAQGNAIPHRRVQAVDAAKGEKAIPNPNSGLVWEFTHVGDIKKFENVMHGSVSNVAVQRGLVIAADLDGLVHCLDARTGQRYWAYDTLGPCYASPLIVGEQVYVADEDGEVAIFGLSPDPDVALQKLNGGYLPLQELSVESYVYCSPIYANGVLYVASRSELFAIAADKDEPNLDLTQGYWPQWRGPNRDNASSEKGLLQAWPDGGPPQLWTAAGLGEGIASVSVAGGKLFTVGYQDQSEFVVALDDKTGELRWATRIGPAINETPLMRWLAQRSPTVDRERLYTITANGVLVCLSTANGRELWRKDYAVDFGAKRPIYGFCDYPLVDGNQLVCTPGAAQAAVVALDKQTGKVLWKTAAPVGDETRGNYTAMVAADVGGLRQYVTYVPNLLIGVAADDGRLLWTHDKIAQGMPNSLTPIVHGDRVFCTSNNGIGVVLKLTRDGKKTSFEELYRQPLRIDHFQDGTVLVGDHVYSLDQRGWPLCLAWNTGEAVWKAERSLGFGKATVIYADGCLHYRRFDGQMTLAKATPAGFTRLGEFTIPEHSKTLGATMPVIASGRLYLRDDQRLLCYDVRQDASSRPKPETKTITLNVPKAAGPAAIGAAGDETKTRTLRSVFVPTPQDVVARMLELAALKKADVLYDLGSGDGRIVITAAKQYGSKAVGFEIDKELIELSRSKSEAAGVKQRVTIEAKDLFTVDLREADVIAVYLLPKQLEKLLPQLEKLKAGARIVSHQFEIPGIKPERTLTVDSQEDGGKHTLHLWTAPLKKSPPAVPMQD